MKFLHLKIVCCVVHSKPCCSQSMAYTGSALEYQQEYKYNKENILLCYGTVTTQVATFVMILRGFTVYLAMCHA